MFRWNACWKFASFYIIREHRRSLIFYVFRRTVNARPYEKISCLPAPEFSTFPQSFQHLVANRKNFHKFLWSPPCFRWYLRRVCRILRPSDAGDGEPPKERVAREAMEELTDRTRRRRAGGRQESTGRAMTGHKDAPPSFLHISRKFPPENPGEISVFTGNSSIQKWVSLVYLT